MPIDTNYVPPRAEPVQIAAGDSQPNIQVGFNIASVAIDNYTQYWAFIQPSNRPGFWISPYQVGFIQNLYPPCNSISVTQSISGPSTDNIGVIPSTGGSVNLLIFDAPLSPQAGIITQPNPIYDFASDNVIVPFPGPPLPSIILTAGVNQNLIIKTLRGLIANSEIITQAYTLYFEEVPPPPAPINPFVWDLVISPEVPHDEFSFDFGTAVIHSGSSLVWNADPESWAYYDPTELPTIRAEALFYRTVV